MYITICKKSTNSLNPFQRTLDLLDHTQLKLHDYTVASMDVQLHAANKQNKPTYSRDIGALCFSVSIGHAQVCLTTPNKYYMT